MQQKLVSLLNIFHVQIISHLRDCRFEEKPHDWVSLLFLICKHEQEVMLKKEKGNKNRVLWTSAQLSYSDSSDFRVLLFEIRKTILSDVNS